MDRIIDFHKLWLELAQGKPVSKLMVMGHDSKETYASKYGITEIGIERTGGEGPGEVYRAVIQADGMVFYEGRYGVPCIGEYEGKIDPFRFSNLAAFVEEIRFFDLMDGYSYSMLCCSFVYTA